MERLHYEISQTYHAGNETVDGTVTAETMFFITWQYDEEAVPQPKHSGIYRDTFTKTPAGWRFKRRELYIDHK